MLACLTCLSFWRRHRLFLALLLLGRSFCSSSLGLFRLRQLCFLGFDTRLDILFGFLRQISLLLFYLCIIATDCLAKHIESAHCTLAFGFCIVSSLFEARVELDFCFSCVFRAPHILTLERCDLCCNVQGCHWVRWFTRTFSFVFFVLLLYLIDSCSCFRVIFVRLD